MIKKFSKYLSDYFVKIGIVERKNKSWCQYVIEKKAIQLIFGIERSVAKDNLTHSLLRLPFSLDGIDLTYLFMICEQTFNIRFTEQDSNNYGLLTPKNWIDVIESHL